MIRNFIAGLFALLSISWVISCGPAFISQDSLQQKDYSVVQLDTLFELTASDIYDHFARSSQYQAGGVVPRDQVRDFVDSMVVDTLIGIKASRLDLSDYYDEYRLYKARFQRYLINRYFEEAIYKQVTFDSASIVEFYQSRPDLFAVEEKVLVHQILISPVGLQSTADSLYYRRLTNDELVAEAEKTAFQIRRLLDFGEPFDQVAKKYSHDTRSAATGGLIGWTNREVYLDPFDSVAFSMKPMEISDPYLDRTGWHILKLEEYQAPGIPPLDSTQYEIAKASYIQLQANLLVEPLRDSIHGAMQLTFNEALLDTNVYKVDQGVWAAILNGQDSIEFYDIRSLEESKRREHNVSNTTVEHKKQILRILAAPFAFAQAACASGLDTLPDVRREDYNLRHQYARSVVAKGISEPGWIPGDSLVRRYFEQHRADFQQGQPLAIQQIIVSDSLLGEFIRDQVLAGVDFLDLAESYYPGEPSIRRDLANLGPIGPDDVPASLYDLAQTTPAGEVTHPHHTEYGYHVVKVISKADTVELADVRQEISALLKGDHQQKVFTKFRDNIYREMGIKFTAAIAPIRLSPIAERPSR